MLLKWFRSCVLPSRAKNKGGRKKVTDRRPFSEGKNNPDVPNNVQWFSLLNFLSRTVAVIIWLHLIRELVFDRVA